MAIQLKFLNSNPAFLDVEDCVVGGSILVAVIFERPMPAVRELNERRQMLRMFFAGKLEYLGTAMRIVAFLR